jgi:hypothetical protein
MTVLFLSGYEHYKRCSLGRSGDQMIEIPFSDFVLHQKNDRISALNPGIPAWGAGDKSPSHR